MQSLDFDDGLKRLAINGDENRIIVVNPTDVGILARYREKLPEIEGLSEIKNTSVATLATIVKAKVFTIGSKIGSKIGATVGTVFGPVGTTIGSFVDGVVGKMAGTIAGSKIVETAKRVRSAVKSVVSKVTSTVRSVGSKIKSGLKKLFSW